MEEGVDDYEKRVDCTVKIIKGCFVLLEYNTKKILEERGRESFKGDMKLEHDITNIGYFDEMNRNAWSSDVKQMMEHEVSVYLLNQYRERKMPIDTLYIKIGNEIIARTMIPCAPEEDCFPTNQ